MNRELKLDYGLRSGPDNNGAQSYSPALPQSLAECAGVGGVLKIRFLGKEVTIKKTKKCEHLAKRTIYHMVSFKLKSAHRHRSS